MVSENGNESIRKAISFAQEKRDRLAAEFDKIKQELEKLDSFLLSGQKLIGEEVTVNVPTSAEPVRIIRYRIQEGSVADHIYHTLKEHQKAMTLSELLDVFREKGWPLSKANPKEVLRYAMRRKPRIFKKVDTSTWDLVERQLFKKEESFLDYEAKEV